MVPLTKQWEQLSQQHLHWMVVKLGLYCGWMLQIVSIWLQVPCGKFLSDCCTASDGLTQGQIKVMAFSLNSSKINCGCHVYSCDFRGCEACFNRLFKSCKIQDMQTRYSQGMILVLYFRKRFLLIYQMAVWLMHRWMNQLPGARTVTLCHVYNVLCTNEVIFRETFRLKYESPCTKKSIRNELWVSTLSWQMSLQIPICKL